MVIDVGPLRAWDPQQCTTEDVQQKYREIIYVLLDIFRGPPAASDGERVNHVLIVPPSAGKCLN